MLIGLVGFVVVGAAVGLAPDAPARRGRPAPAGRDAPGCSPRRTPGSSSSSSAAGSAARAFGLFGFTVSTASAVGPVLGGLIIAAAGEENGWRWLFLVNLPIGLVAFVAVCAWCPRRGSRPIERGAGSTSSARSCSAGRAVPALPGRPRRGRRTGCRSCSCAACRSSRRRSSRWERRLRRRGRPPLLDLTLLRTPARLRQRADGRHPLLHRVHRTPPGDLGLPPGGLAYTPLEAGLLIMPFAVGSAVSAPLAGRYVSDLGRRLTVGALVVDDRRRRCSSRSCRRAATRSGRGRCRRSCWRGSAVAPSSRRTSRSRSPTCRRGWAARPVAPSRPGSGSARRSAPRC